MIAYIFPFLRQNSVYETLYAHQLFVKWLKKCGFLFILKMGQTIRKFNQKFHL